jgi:hypothetical protein
MKWLLFVVIASAVIVIGLLLHRSHLSPNRLQVDPHAREEIEKAKRR